jgi:protease-4
MTTDQNTPSGSLSRNSTQASNGSGKWGCLLALAAFQAFLIFVALFAAIMVLMVKAGLKGHRSDYAMDEQPYMEEIWSSGEGDTKAIVIPVRGFIGFDDNDDLFSSGLSSTAVLMNSITRATSDEDVSAIILDVDSGGGGITASDIIYNALKKFKESRSGRVIVVIMGDVAASGAYYISLPADKIIAHPTSITGSIGVIMQSLNIKGLEEKIGLKGVTIKSGKNKDLLNPFEEVSPSHTNILQNIVDELQGRFISVVAENRKLPKDKVVKLADGRIYTSSEAKEEGLIDDIGYWEDAVASTKTLLGVSELKIYRYQGEFNLAQLFRASGGVKDISSFLPERRPSGFLYYWEPSLTAGE